MTQAQTKEQEAVPQQTPQQHHQKAAEQHEEASKHHIRKLVNIVNLTTL